MRRRNTYLAIILVEVFIAKSALASETTWKIHSNDRTVIKVDHESVVRESLPDSFFGININYRRLQEQLWELDRNAFKPQILSHLKTLPGIWYRYPGGIVGNGFSWKESLGDISQRGYQKTPYGGKQSKAYFGLNEYLDFIEEINGTRFYVLNLVGLDPKNPMHEADIPSVSKSNAELAKYMLHNSDSSNDVNYFQLGNELDRFKYEWSSEKYIARSIATIDKISKEDEDAKFVAFLRDFKWKYKKDKSRGESHPNDFLKEIMTGLPMVEDYSLHHYYDGKRKDGKSRDIPFRLKLMQRSIDTYKEARGKAPNVWITEHARQKSSDKPGSDGTRFYSSNLGAAISTADYLIAIAQIPEIQGSFWHGLNAGPWQLFDFSAKHSNLSPRPIFWAIRLLTATSSGKVYRTHVLSPNQSGYSGGYDTRAAVFGLENRDGVSIWTVNRSRNASQTELVYKPFSNQTLTMCHYHISGSEGEDPDDIDLEPILKLSPTPLEVNRSENGSVTLELPPSSVSVFTISAENNCNQLE